ncbi:uncharacterized protein ACRADG_002063 [Cochliomyia hominivorax]
MTFALCLFAVIALAAAAAKPDILAYSAPVVADDYYTIAYADAYTAAYSDYPYTTSYVAAPYAAAYSYPYAASYLLRK